MKTKTPPRIWYAEEHGATISIFIRDDLESRKTDRKVCETSQQWGKLEAWKMAQLITDAVNYYQVAKIKNGLNTYDPR